MLWVLKIGFNDVSKWMNHKCDAQCYVFFLRNLSPLTISLTINEIISVVRIFLDSHATYIYKLHCLFTFFIINTKLDHLQYIGCKLQM